MGMLLRTEVDPCLLNLKKWAAVCRESDHLDKADLVILEALLREVLFNFESRLFVVPKSKLFAGYMPLGACKQPERVGTPPPPVHPQNCDPVDLPRIRVSEMSSR